MSSLYLEHVERMLEKAEDEKNLDAFNYWFSERVRLSREEYEYEEKEH